MMKSYRVRRPKQHDELLNLMRDKELGIFSTLKSALVFSAAVGFKEAKRIPFSDQGEPIAFSLFNEHHDRPFVFCLALTEHNDVTYLREEKFLEAISVFEEYASGGLEILSGILDKAHMKESIEAYLMAEDFGLIDDITKGW